MPEPRTYADACGMSHALDLIGQRWALHVIRELLLTPKRYRDLKAELPSIATNMLTDRLAELEAHGLVRRRRMPGQAGVWVYELTRYGADLEPIISALGRWALRSPLHQPDLPLSATSFAISLRANVIAERAAAVSGCYLLHVPGLDVHAHLARGALTVEAGTSHTPDIELTGSVDGLAALVYDDVDLERAVRTGQVVLSGAPDAARAFLGVFAFPAQASAGDLT